MGALLAVLLALAPQPKVSATDDFNDVVKAAEAANRCDAVKVYKADDDEVRLVLFRCAQGDVLVPFMLRGEDGWYPMRTLFREPRPDVKAI